MIQHTKDRDAEKRGHSDHSVWSHLQLNESMVTELQTWVLLVETDEENRAEKTLMEEKICM